MEKDTVTLALDADLINAARVLAGDGRAGSVSDYVNEALAAKVRGDRRLVYQRALAADPALAAARAESRRVAQAMTLRRRVRLEVVE